LRKKGIMDKKKARKIVDKIIEDLTGRCGGDHWFYGCDKEIQKEIRDEWTQIVLSETQSES